MGKKLLFASVLLCFLSVAHANKVDIRTTEQAVAFGNQLMMDISRGKIQQAWRNVKANSTIPPDRVDAFATDYDKHLNQTIQFLGQPLGVEMVATEAFGRSIMRITYLVKYNLSGVAWYMYFYKMNDQWVLSEFNFDLNSNSVFAKINQAKGGSDTSAVILAWQEKVDQRLAEIEQKQTVKPSIPIDPTALVKNDGNGSATVKLLEMEARIAQLEQQIANYESANQRLQALEQNMAEVSNKIDQTTFQIDTDEIAKMRKTIIVLKQQHPYVEFP